mmetsp:Transcript_3736/g.9669  ORF Transcript_3736/g.9669 Transcript_3736/m.9669 type:complete len:264 (+) Transcript_3736:107-898(+)
MLGTSSSFNLRRNNIEFAPAKGCRTISFLVTFSLLQDETTVESADTLGTWLSSGGFIVACVESVNTGCSAFFRRLSNNDDLAAGLVVVCFKDRSAVVELCSVHLSFSPEERLANLALCGSQLLALCGSGHGPRPPGSNVPAVIALLDSVTVASGVSGSKSPSSSPQASSTVTLPSCPATNSRSFFLEPNIFEDIVRGDPSGREPCLWVSTESRYGCKGSFGAPCMHGMFGNKSSPIEFSVIRLDSQSPMSLAPKRYVEREQLV